MKYDKHIFICTNDRGENSTKQSCGSCGGLDIRKEFVSLINASGLIVIYPQGYWYLNVEKRNIEKIFYESVIGDNPVAELIADKKQLDNID